jgi:cysteinyl-tRNA synthetase
MYEEGQGASGKVHEKYGQKFHEAINDDLDTPKAIALMWELMKDDSVSKADKVATLKEMDSVLDIGLSDAPDEIVRELGIVSQSEIPDDIQALLDERQLARTVQNWSEADRLRETLNLKGYIVEDGPQGQKVSKV